ncbi:MAG: YceI family protein [Elusimicrobiota bacterium]
MIKTFTVGVLFALAAPLAAKTYEIDPVHSSVMFRIHHLVRKLPGNFTKFEGNFEYEKGNPKMWKAMASIDAASINTNNEDRDKHLRAPDFFDVEKCPKLTFVGVKVEEVKDNMAKLYGDLTMHCVTKPVVLDVEIGEEIKNPWGKMVLGVSAKTKISRKDFGISWNKILEAGGFVLGDEVEIMMDLEASPKEEAAPAKTATKQESKKIGPKGK